MATKKITDLVELTSAASGDVLPIVDINEDITKKISASNLLATKQDTLVSGTNIKTINSTSLLGSGDISIQTNPSGGAGAIQFSDGSAFASDASNLFWDDTNKRLGVGTNTPTHKLDVSADAKINGLTVGLGSGGIGTNTAVGNSALATNTIGSSNSAFGQQSLNNNTTGANNTALGDTSMILNNTGSSNTAIGSRSLQNNTTGINNVALGFQSMQINSTGSNNVSIGRDSLRFNTASNNVAVGREAAYSNTSGTGITAIGYQALRASTGANNTALGFQAGDNITTGAGNVCIGSGAEPENATDSNKFVVGSASANAGAVATETIIPDSSWTVRINGANYKIPMLAI